MNVDQSSPIVLANEEPEELALLRNRLVEAGVKNPLVTLEDDFDVKDYFGAVFLAAPTIPRLVPCLIFLDFKLQRLSQLVGWLQGQKVLQKLKIVILGTDETIRNKWIDRTCDVQFAPKLPSVAALAEFVAQAASRVAC